MDEPVDFLYHPVEAGTEPADFILSYRHALLEIAELHKSHFSYQRPEGLGQPIREVDG